MHTRDEIEERARGIRVGVVAESEHLVPHDQLEDQKHQRDRPGREEGELGRAGVAPLRCAPGQFEGETRKAKHHRVEPQQGRFRDGNPVRRLTGQFHRVEAHVVGREEQEEQHADDGEKAN